ncbi:MAG: DUF3418 domain-containing protein, partial [Aquabacterium sp.]
MSSSSTSTSWRRDLCSIAYYDQQLPADVCSGASFERWYRE